SEKTETSDSEKQEKGSSEEATLNMDSAPGGIPLGLNSEKRQEDDTQLEEPNADVSELEVCKMPKSPEIANDNRRGQDILTVESVDEVLLMPRPEFSFQPSSEDHLDDFFVCSLSRGETPSGNPPLKRLFTHETA